MRVLRPQQACERRPIDDGKGTRFASGPDVRTSSCATQQHAFPCD